jgi:hypothetical protein
MQLSWHLYEQVEFWHRASSTKALLENRREDEKASAGDHRIPGCPSRQPLAYSG